PAHNAALSAPSIPEHQIPVPGIPPRQPFGEYSSPPRRPYPEYVSNPPPRPVSYAGDYSAPPPFFPQVPPQPYPPTPYCGGGYPPPSYGPPPPVSQPPPGPSFDLPDPYLQKRYQSPLPLPEGARNARPSQPQSQTPT
ncbi:hypothetical protein C8Q80DRAFT_1059056, partial [Daedaleopsis nitida]